MATYSVNHVNVSNSIAQNDHVMTALWNPSGSISIYALEVGLTLVNAADSTSRYGLVRTTTRGTATTTVTPNANSAWQSGVSPPSGAVLDYLLSSAGAPTQAGPMIMSMHITPTTRDLSFTWKLDGPGFRIPPGQGLGVVQIGATRLIGSVYFVWEEGDPL